MSTRLPLRQRARVYVAVTAAVLLAIMANVHATTGPIYFPRSPSVPNQLQHPVCWANPADPWAVTWPDGTPKEVVCP